MNLRPEEISSVIKDMIKQYDNKLDTVDVGTVIEVGDGIARIHGLDNCMAGELLEFPAGLYGMVLNLEEDNVGCVLLGSDRTLKEGDTAKRTGRIVEVPVGEAMIGRVVNSLGQPLDGKGPINSNKFRPIESKAPGVIERKSVSSRPSRRKPPRQRRRRPSPWRISPRQRSGRWNFPCRRGRSGPYPESCPPTGKRQTPIEVSES